MALLDAQMTKIAADKTEIVLPFRKEPTQRHGFVHVSTITAMVDSTCGYAAQDLMPPGLEVLTIEFKGNLLYSAVGERFIARGQMTKLGRTTMTCTDEYATTLPYWMSGPVGVLAGTTSERI